MKFTHKMISIFIAIIFIPCFLFYLIISWSGVSEIEKYNSLAEVSFEADDISMTYTAKTMLKQFYGVRATYEYIYNDNNYLSHSIGIGTPQWAHRKDVQKFIQETLDKGVAYVDINKPEVSFLVPPSELTEIRTISLHPIVAFIFGVFLMGGIASKSRQPLSEDVRFGNLGLRILISFILDAYFVLYFSLIIIIVFFDFKPIKAFLAIQNMSNVTYLFYFFSLTLIYRVIFSDRTLGQVLTNLCLLDIKTNRQPTKKKLVLRITLAWCSLGISYLISIFIKNKFLYCLTNTRFINFHDIPQGYWIDNKTSNIKSSNNNGLTFGDKTLLSILYGVLIFIVISFILLVFSNT